MFLSRQTQRRACAGKVEGHLIADANDPKGADPIFRGRAAVAPGDQRYPVPLRRDALEDFVQIDLCTTGKRMRNIAIVEQDDVHGPSAYPLRGREDTREGGSNFQSAKRPRLAPNTGNLWTSIYHRR